VSYKVLFIMQFFVVQFEDSSETDHVKFKYGKYGFVCKHTGEDKRVGTGVVCHLNLQQTRLFGEADQLWGSGYTCLPDSLVSHSKPHS